MEKKMDGDGKLFDAYLRCVEGWLREWRGIEWPEGCIDDLCARIEASVANIRDDNRK